jgi:hypothetical protein
MTELNAQGREIWFSRVLWSYMPCTWQGLALLILFVGGGALAAMVAPAIVRAVAHADIGGPPAAVVLIPVIIGGWIVAERHAPSR